MTARIRSSARAPARGAEGGFTLIELVVTVAVIALVLASAVRGFRSLAKSDLRSAAAHFSGACRYLFDRASTTGRTHRLVVDFAEQRYWAEVSDDRFFIPGERETEQTRRRDEADLQRRKEQEAVEQQRAADLAQRTQGAYDLSQFEQPDFRPKRARFAAFREAVIKPVALKRVHVTDVYTPRLAEPLSEGRAYIYFFPMGQAEAAVVHLSDEADETTYSVVVHPLTGRTKVFDSFIQPPVEAAFDDEGNQVGP